MGQPAARVGDMHTCPMVTPGLPPIPHVGGPVLPPGVPTVFIGGMPAATMGNMCLCVGPPDVIVRGSFTVLIGGRPAARMGDNTAHGGVITMGCPTVLIGDFGMGMGGMVEMILNMTDLTIAKFMNSVPIERAKAVAQMAALSQAAQAGTALVEVCT
ncbi:PAAR domain-containing protein [Spirosoma spitsbergense]|uniref:PAAR domain-containing protein n=1 Tax=Spirosoma spitsbergense TaxID=431554 RepID=UPI00035DFD44